MTFYEVLAQVLDWLQRDGRVSYRALKRQFGLDDAYIEDLKIEIIQAKKVAVDEDGAVLVWTGARPQPLHYPRVTSQPLPSRVQTRLDQCPSLAPPRQPYPARLQQTRHHRTQRCRPKPMCLPLNAAN